MRKIGPAFIVSVLLHLGLFVLVFVGWHSTSKLELSSAVPVEIVSSTQMQEMAKTEVDPKAVKPPAPEPEPPTPPVPEAKPTPPVPEPKPKADAKPDPAASKDGLKKPKPEKAKKPDLLDSILNQPTIPQSKSKTRSPASPTTRPTDGASNQGSAPKDTGPAASAIKAAIQRNWAPCSVTGAKDIPVTIGFTISSSGMIIRGPEWIDPVSDAHAQQAASLAKLSIKKGEPYIGLPEDSYNRPWEFTFRPKDFCRNQ